jgi:hypothetical protein
MLMYNSFAAFHSAAVMFYFWTGGTRIMDESRKEGAGKACSEESASESRKRSRQEVSATSEAALSVADALAVLYGSQS